MLWREGQEGRARKQVCTPQIYMELVLSLLVSNTREKKNVEKNGNYLSVLKMYSIDLKSFCKFIEWACYILF